MRQIELLIKKNKNKKNSRVKQMGFRESIDIKTVVVLPLQIIPCQIA